MAARHVMTRSLPRRVEPEILDSLSSNDPRSRRSRQDLRRIQRAMATVPIMQRALDRGASGFVPRTLLELGAGDGSLMLRLARGRAARWPDVGVMLLDRLDLVSPQTLEEMRKVGWTPRVMVTDVFDWLAACDGVRWDVVVANLFMHHFSPVELEKLLVGIAARTEVFLCCEPRRSMLALTGSHLIGLLGAGAVTRHDAVTSVHAGFRAQELSSIWPDRENWTIHEYSAGLFSHIFVARRKVR